jgi:hypothetical protein
MRCIKCHRPLLHPPVDGMGPTCRKRSAPAPQHERDLFGFDVEKATAAAMHSVRVHIESLAADARAAVRYAARAARVRMGVWRA